MVTMVPWLAVTIAGTNSRIRRKWLRILTSKTLETESSVVFRIGRPAPVPALFIRIDGTPTLERIKAAQAETSSGEAILHLKKEILGAVFLIRTVRKKAAEEGADEVQRSRAGHREPQP